MKNVLMEFQIELEVTEVVVFSEHFRKNILYVECNARITVVLEDFDHFQDSCLQWSSIGFAARKKNVDIVLKPGISCGTQRSAYNQLV